jgi:uncharacterized protein YecE (DUF72 family)
MIHRGGPAASIVLRVPAASVTASAVPFAPRSPSQEREAEKAEFEEFVSTAQVLGEKLGPMVFQFFFFNDSAFSSHVQFVSRLPAFFKKLPRASGCRFAVEIRNKYWLKPRLLDLLRQNNVALVL